MRKLFACLAIIAFSLASPAWAAREEGSFIVAESEGAGLTREEALMDARRNAVQQATGVLSKGVTEVIDDLARENVVQLSRAFIEKFDVLEERESDGRWSVKIKAWVRGEDLLGVLLQKDPDTSPFDGAGLFVSALTREQRVKEAGEVLIEIFNSVPYENYVRTDIGAGGVNLRAGSGGEVSLNTRFSFDRERYFTQAVPLFGAVLDYVAEAKLKDVPFIWEPRGSNPVVVTPPSGIASIAQYMELMEMQKGNRYIDVPGAGNFANVYLLKKNYYFDCYHVSPEAFAALMENLLLSGAHNRLAGRTFEGADLKIAFKDSGGRLVNEHVQPLNLHNVMIFTNLDGLRRSPYVRGNPGQLDGQRHALFILPCMGTIDASNNYLLIENSTASISAKLPPEDMRQVSQADSSIVMKRQ
ncbi:MAG: hypothetical protein FWG71_05540 [Synergistaceae bacterium]|nr:hypothetical protein [Synergistaceae bacterium]